MSHVVKWDTLVRKAVQGLYDQKSGWFPKDRDFLCLLPAIEARRDPRDLREEWYRAAEDIVRRWDVRRVKGLIKAFPLIVPKHCLDKKITAFMDESTDWMIEFE